MKRFPSPFHRVKEGKPLLFLIINDTWNTVSIPFSSGQGRQVMTVWRRIRKQNHWLFPSPFHRVKEGKFADKIQRQERRFLWFPSPFHRVKEGKLHDLWPSGRQLR